MVENTRYARVQASVAPLRTMGGTQVASLRAAPRASIEQLFNEQQRVMASALREEPRPGLFIFATHHRYGLVARLWLEATHSPRAGFIGRHDEVDLALPLDDALSLRHLMFVVRLQGASVRFLALDLESNNGLRLESDLEVKLVEAAGPLILSAAAFHFFCFPTGTPPPWDQTRPRAWPTLAPRAPTRVERSVRLAEGTPAGRVEVSGPTGVRAANVGSDALRRGVLIGRDARCDLVAPEPTVSRVHVALLSLGDDLLVIDTGSTNGTWRLDEELDVALLHERDVLGLGEDVTLTWRAAH